MNRPTASKINWTALIVALVNVAAIAELFPAEFQREIVNMVNIVGPAMIVTFRTWYTAP